MTHFQIAKRTFGRVVRGRCPRCGEGAIHGTKWQKNPACEKCSLPYVRDTVDFAMLMYVSTAAITGLFVIGYFVIGFPATGWYRLGVAAGALTLMIGTAPLRRSLVVGFLYLSHVFFDEGSDG